MQEASVSGTWHRGGKVRYWVSRSEQSQSRNLDGVYKKTHDSCPALKPFGSSLAHVPLSTDVPSAHWYCPVVRPISVADNQKAPAEAAEIAII